MTAEGGGPRRYAWVPAVAGVALAAVGGGLLAVADSTASRLDAPNTLPRNEALDVRDRANFQQSLGAAGLAVGAAALVCAGGLFFLGGGDGAQAEVFVAPGAAGVAVKGVLP